MSTAHIKAISAVVIVLAVSVGATSQTFASNAIEYSENICKFETRGAGEPLNYPGKIRPSNQARTVVTCPVEIPAKTNAFRTHLSTRVSVVVKYHQAAPDLPLECLVRWTAADNGMVNSTVQASSRHSGHSEFFFSERIPRGSSMVLRCEIPKGTRLGGYRVW